MSTSVSTDTHVERHLRMKEAAALLGVSRATLYRWLPRIRGIRRIPAGGIERTVILIPESSLAEFLRGYECNPAAREAA